MRRILACFLLLPLGLAACSGGPNVKSAKDYDAPPAPPVRSPLYNPYAAYGEANATWTPPVFNRDGTIMKPAVRPATIRVRPLGLRSIRRKPLRPARHLLIRRRFRTLP
jgi:hypothetical protein